MEPKKIILAFLLLASVAYAYDNSTVTNEYLLLTNNQPVQAIHQANTNVWGDWFWFILAAAPYIGLYLSQGGKTHMPTIWLTCVLAAYGSLIVTGETPNYAFYLITVVWVMEVLIKLLSPIYRN